MFSIVLHDQPAADEGDGPYFLGRITIGDHSEAFHAAAASWSADRYRGQWRAAAQALLRGESRTAFVTSFTHPDAHYNRAWAGWRVGETVAFQELLLLRDELPAPLDVARIERFVPERRVLTDEGQTISEWVLPLNALQDVAA